MISIDTSSMGDIQSIEYTDGRISGILKPFSANFFVFTIAFEDCINTKFMANNTVLRIKSELARKAGQYLILSNLLSKSISNWNLYYIDDVDDEFLPNEVRHYINKGFYLAGGALVSYLTRTPINDYDLFFVGDADEFNKAVMDFNADYETYMCLSKTSDNCKIQLIKNIYSSPDHIIGGFDIDPCRLILMNNKIYGTMGGVISKKQKIHSIDPSYISATISNRIVKYCSRGYDAINVYSLDIFDISVKRFSDFDSMYDFGKLPSNEVDDLAVNAKFLSSGLYHKLYIRKIKYSLNDFMNCSAVKPYDAFMIKENYHHYDKITDITLNSNSFIPILDSYDFNFRDITPNYHHILPEYPELVQLIWCLKKKFTKYIRVKILLYYIEFLASELMSH